MALLLLFFLIPRHKYKLRQQDFGNCTHTIQYNSLKTKYLLNNLIDRQNKSRLEILKLSCSKIKIFNTGPRN